MINITETFITLLVLREYKDVIKNLGSTCKTEVFACRYLRRKGERLKVHKVKKRIRRLGK